MLWLSALLWRFYASSACYLARSQTSAEYWKHFMARFDSVHAFGCNNSVESEPIWMKSGALWVHCLGLALTDFRLDPHSSESWTARRSFVFCQVSNARFYWFSVGQISQNLNTARWSARRESFWNRILKIFPKGVVFPKTPKNEIFSSILQLQATITPQWLQIDGNS